MARVHGHPVVVERGDGGMGAGMVLGMVLAIALGIGMLWFVMMGRVLNPTAGNSGFNNNPTINVQPPSIKVPDKITINPPAQAPAPAANAAQ